MNKKFTVSGSPSQLLPAQPMFPTYLLENVKLENAVWKETTKEVYWYGKILPIGTKYKSFQTDNHGYVALESPVSGRAIYQY